jgi:hypothetical protein
MAETKGLQRSLPRRFRDTVCRHILVSEFSARRSSDCSFERAILDLKEWKMNPLSALLITTTLAVQRLV